jgi:O-antigen ligase
MTESSHTRTNTAALLVILALSAFTMVWLFWHFPVITAVATAAILAALGVSARLARSADTESDANASMTDLGHEKQRV